MGSKDGRLFRQSKALRCSRSRVKRGAAFVAIEALRASTMTSSRNVVVCDNGTGVRSDAIHPLAFSRFLSAFEFDVPRLGAHFPRACAVNFAFLLFR